jgi:hypothetical protein
MPLLVYMQLQIGFYNNDSLCVLGGMVVVAASLGWLRGKKPARALAWMGVGLLLTSVKLTALLLVGTYVLSCLLLRFSRLRMLPRHWLLYGLAVALLCAAPYVYMLVTLGSPAPNTAGQLALLSGHPTCRIEASARVTFTQWLAFFLIKFADQLSVSETTFLAILIYGTALLTVGVWRQQKPTTLHMDALRSVALASFIATLMTLTIHTIFSWQRYRDYGWICDSLLRYYLPLIGAYAAVSSHALMQFASHTKALDETPRP